MLSRYGEENLTSWKNHLVHLWPTSFIQANYVQPPQKNFSCTPMGITSMLAPTAAHPQGGFKGELQATLCQKLWGGECRVSGNRKPRSPVIRVSLRIRPPFASFNVFSLIRRGETAKCIWLAFLVGWNSFCLAFTTFLRQRTQCLILALTEERHCTWHLCRLFLLPITGTREIIYHKIPVSEVISCSLLRRACEIFSLECF